jgi:hypothetical protein
MSLLVEQSAPLYLPFHWDRSAVWTIKSQMGLEAVIPKLRNSARVSEPHDAELSASIAVEV